MRSTGTYISAIGHTGLIGWLLLGWGLSADPLDFDTLTVTTVSSDEFAALNTPVSTPEPGTAEPDEPPQPQIEDTPPTPPVQAPPSEQSPPPAPVEQPVDDNTPPPPPVVTPPTEVTDDLDVASLPPPRPAPAAPNLPTSTRPSPRPADIVAPTPTEPQEPDRPIADEARDAVEQDDTADVVVEQDPEEATATEETTTEIVNQDDAPSAPEDPVDVPEPVEEPVVTAAPTTSVRPSARPSRPVQPDPEPEIEVAEAPAPEPEAETGETITDTLETILSNEAPAVPAGPPMTRSEKEAFRVAINECWNIDPGSEAARARVIVMFELGRDGKVIGNPQLISGTGAAGPAVNVAYEAARRAILRCQRSTGYQLPPEKYEEWREVTATFDASGARY